jgi:RND family efflux transporter MFP subunit
MVRDPIRSRDSVALLLLLSSLSFSACDRKEPPPQEIIRPVPAMRIGEIGSELGRSFPGRAMAYQELNLSFRIGGPLIQFPAKVGDAVQKGQVLARIDPRDFDVGLRQTQGQLEETRAVLLRAESDYERQQRIFKEDPGATSESAIDRAREQRDRTRANIRSLEAAVDSARDQLEDTYLRAPFGGTVVATFVENYEQVRPQQQVLRVVDTSRIKMVVNIPENFISLAKRVKDITVVFDPFPKEKLAAQILEVSPEASQLTRTYPMTLVMNQPKNAKILPGMAGRAEAQALERAANESSQIIIPMGAAFSSGEGGKTYVWVINDQTKTVTRREVTLGTVTNTGTEVRAGLQRGEWIATAGVNSLRDGQRVRIVEKVPTS